MPRIRTVKPDFFRHELLQELEVSNLGKFPMLTFAGLWTVCDNQGVFPWKPRHLHLDILPFIDFDFEETLNILMDAGLLNKFESDGNQYGHIPKFKDHQRFSGKEAKDGKKYPTPGNVCEAQGNNKGSNGEASGKYPGAQEKEKEKEKERIKAREGGVGETKTETPEQLPVDNSPKELFSKQDDQAKFRNLFNQVLNRWPATRDCNWHLYLQNHIRCHPQALMHTFESLLKHGDNVDNPIAYCNRIILIENQSYNARDHEAETANMRASPQEAAQVMKSLGDIMKMLGVSQQEARGDP